MCSVSFESAPQSTLSNPTKRIENRHKMHRHGHRCLCASACNVQLNQSRTVNAWSCPSVRDWSCPGMADVCMQMTSAETTQLWRCMLDWRHRIIIYSPPGELAHSTPLIKTSGPAIRVLIVLRRHFRSHVYAYRFTVFPRELIGVTFFTYYLE